MAYSEEVKQKILKRIENGDKIKNISEETGISITTLYNWRKKTNLSKENQEKDETNKSTKKEIEKEKKIVGFKQSNENTKEKQFIMQAIEQSKIIKRLIKEKRFKEAKRIGERFPNNAPIQSQMITIAIQEGDVNRAKEIGKKFEKDAPIQSQMVTIAIQEGDLKRAKEMGKRFEGHAPIQSQMVTIAIQENNFDRAKEIGAKFPENAPIQSQMVTIAIKEGDLKRAKEIGKRFEKYVPIQSQMVTIAIQEDDFDRAKEIGAKFPENPPIQSQMVTIAIREGDLKRAKEIGERFENYAPIQSQMVTIAIREGDFDRAKEIGMKFPNNELIQNQIAKMKDLQKYEKIFEIEEEKKQTKVNSKINSKNNKKKILDSLKTKLYFDKVDDQLISEIELSEDLDEFEKIVSLLAICEKRNMKGKAKEVLKTFHPTDKQEKSVVNGIMERIKSKKLQIFDIAKYDLILHWSFNDKLKAQYEKELRAEREEREAKKQQITVLPKIETTQSTIKPVEKHPKAPIHSGEKLDKSAEYRKKLAVTSPKTSNEQPNIINHRNNEEKNVNNQTQMMINYIHQFIQKQREKVYVNMQSQNVEIQSDAISKWDRIEILLERIAEKSKDTQYIENLYNRVLNLSKSNDKGMEY